MADRPTDNPLITRELPPALATALRAMRERLIRIINHLPREALMPGLATLLAPRTLPRRPLRRLTAIT
ncbi:MAG TPA: hypothetical protein VHZ96_10835 [Frankiaceae bacterium]|nr:hypothetical protein [Frankiaceae bacterium]